MAAKQTHHRCGATIEAVGYGFVIVAGGLASGSYFWHAPAVGTGASAMSCARTSAASAVRQTQAYNPARPFPSDPDVFCKARASEHATDFGAFAPLLPALSVAPSFF